MLGAIAVTGVPAADEARRQMAKLPPLGRPANESPTDQDGRVLILGGYENPPDGGPVEIFDPGGSGFDYAALVAAAAAFDSELAMRVATGPMLVVIGRADQDFLARVIAVVREVELDGRLARRRCAASRCSIGRRSRGRLASPSTSTSSER